jgi:hypothetical protein
VSQDVRDEKCMNALRLSCGGCIICMFLDLLVLCEVTTKLYPTQFMAVTTYGSAYKDCHGIAFIDRVSLYVVLEEITAHHYSTHSPINAVLLPLGNKVT